MATRSDDPKLRSLRDTRSLNPHPEKVADATFLREEFFDARDAVQVKYEMVRAVVVDGDSVTEATFLMGVHRSGRRYGRMVSLSRRWVSTHSFRPECEA